MCYTVYAIIITPLTYYNLLPITCSILFVSSYCAIISSTSITSLRTTRNCPATTPSTPTAKKRKRAGKDNSNSNVLELKVFSLVSF